MNDSSSPNTPSPATGDGTLSNSEGQRLRGLFDHHPSAVLLLDAQGRIVEANPALKTRFGHEPTAVCGQMLSVLLPDWDSPGLLADLLHHRQPLEARLRHASGQRCEVLVTLLPASAPGPAEACGCFLIARDVSAQRRLQRQMQVQAEILARTHDAVVVLDEGGDVVCWNASAARLYGASAQDMAGKPFARLFAAPGRAALQQGLAATFLQGIAPTELNLQRMGADGQTALLHLSLSRLPGLEPGRGLVLVLGRGPTRRPRLPALRAGTHALRVSTHAQNRAGRRQ